ncbi:MAG: hypothetical protein QG575_1410 [Euryarchaeota archaeon]|jgi:hypothetical protein|nr:hypothetical protein [Euryarchaeota archaeon]
MKRRKTLKSETLLKKVVGIELALIAQIMLCNYAVAGEHC